jgi:putative alpha-1,2-mannosidase
VVAVFPKMILSLVLLVLARAQTNVQYANPIIGTDNIYPGNGNYAGMIPTVGSPFAFTRWTPMTYENDVGTCPYFYQDNIFRGFMATHQPAQWMGESAEIVVSPGTGAVKTSFSDRGLKFTHDEEVSSPQYYKSILITETGHIIAEASAVSRAGALRFTFEDEESAFIAIQATRQSINGEITIDPSKHEIYGWNPERQDSVLGPSPASNFRGYFVAQFDSDFLSWGITHDETLEENSLNGTGSSLSAYVRFPSGSHTINVRIGISYISYDLARESLKRETPSHKSLEEIAQTVESEWAEKLDLVQITNATEDELSIFYTAMYHALQVRRIWLALNPHSFSIVPL